MAVLALSLASLLAPTIAVEVEDEDPREAEALRSWLSMRLLQEGYDLGPHPETADAVVRVGSRDGGLRVEASGARGRHSYAVEDGPASVRRLEVLHRAMMGVDATVSPRKEPRLPALALRFEGEPDEAMIAALTRAAHDQGVALAATPAPGDVLACVAPRDELAEIAIGPAEHGCAEPTLVASRTTGLPTTADDIVSEARNQLHVELPIAHALGPVVAEPREMERPVPTIVRDTGDPVAMHGQPRAEARFGVDGGIVSRGPVDAAMRVMARMGKYEGLGGGIELMVIPSGNSAARVVDTVLAVGPDWQIGLGRITRFHLAATVGADVQTYIVADSTAADVGWVVGLPTGFSFALRNDTRVHLAALPGLSGVARSHRLGDEVVWERAAWRVGVTLGFSHGWRIE